MKSLANWLGFGRSAEALAPGATGSPTVHSSLLNLGCGSRFHPDWLNVDMVPSDPRVLRHDLQQPLPFADQSFTVVYHSHVLEHLGPERALPFLRECRRVLKQPGGILRVVVPDLEGIVVQYLEKLRGALAGDRECQEQYDWAMIELLDQSARQYPDGGEMFKYLCRNPIPALDLVTRRYGHECTSKLGAIQDYVRQGVTPQLIEERRAAFTPEQVGKFRTSGEVHLWMYDRYSLGRLLVAAGFSQAAVTTAQTSRIPDFTRYQLDVLEDGSVRKPDSLFMEAVTA